MQRPRSIAQALFVDGPELVVLATVAAAASAIFGILMGIILLPELSLWTATAYWIIALFSVSWSIAGGLLQIPRTLRLFELMILVVLGITTTRSALSTYVFLTPWLAAVYLGYLIPPLVPAEYLKYTDQRIESHLDEVHSDRIMYSRKRIGWVQRTSWGRAATLFVVPLIASVLAEKFRGSAWFQAEAARLGWSAAMLVLSLLIFLSLIQLLSRQRTWEFDSQLRIDPELTRPWLRLIVGAAVCVTLLGLILPANISPLYALDWNSIMDNLVQRISLRDQEPWRMNPLRWGWGDLQAPETTPGSGTPRNDVGPAILGLLYLLTAAGSLIWIGSHVIRILFSKDRRRIPALSHLLILVISWPFQFLRLLLQSIRAKVKDVASTDKQNHATMGSTDENVEAGTASIDRDSLTVRRLFRLLLDKAHEAGAPRQTSQTAHEFASDLSKTMPEVASDIGHVAEAYQQVRYSARQAPSTWVDKVRVAWQRVMEAFK